MSVNSALFPYESSRISIERLLQSIQRMIVGKQECVFRLVSAMLCGGHVLIEDVPGVGKTSLARALAQSVGCTYKRIQFTPDLLPSDVTGVTVYNERDRQFEFRPGPIMAQIVLADELNRTSPRTQSALLEAMEEGRVTVDGVTYPLPRPFLLIATQNPSDYEGTYRLPEVQLDRFMMKLRLGYPSAAQEVEMLGRWLDLPADEAVRPVLSPEELLRMQQECRSVYVDETVKEYIVAIVHATRQHKEVTLGASPRASLALMRASQAQAYMLGRAYVVPDDVKAVVVSVLSHRIMLRSGARSFDAAGDSADNEAVVRDILKRCPVPGMRAGGRFR